MAWAHERKNAYDLMLADSGRESGCRACCRPTEVGCRCCIKHRDIRNVKLESKGCEKEEQPETSGSLKKPDGGCRLRGEWHGKHCLKTYWGLG